MPTKVQPRDRAQPQLRLSRLGLMAFGVGGWRDYPMVTARRIYMANRDALLRYVDQYVEHVPEPFWAFEAVPDAIRPQLDDDVMHQGESDWGPTVQRSEALKEARRAWLEVNRDRILGAA